MDHLILHWHPIPERNIYGGLFSSQLPQILNIKSKGKLLGSALAMPKQKPIRFEDAVKLLNKNLRTADIGHKPGQYSWLLKNFVPWISDLGYHIEFSGDEFELYIPPVVES